ncbi:sensor histidine kinase [Streptomyces sp. NPDC058953]|uniref:sensor histidine kinase n=1 Tax=unclassified Streptomyces TaxID=2593676 RepID=UPI00367DF6E4
MNRPRTELVVDRRFATARVLVYAAVLVGNFLVRQPPSGARDRCLAAVALLLCAVVVRWPPAALVAQSGLLVTAHALGSGVVTSVKVLAAVTLFELAIRRQGRVPVAGGVLLALAVGANRFGDLPGQLLPVLFKAAVVAGLPLLLGSYIRLLGDAARHAREQAEQQALRAEQEVISARAAERTAVARELHDLVAHHVSSMVLRVGVARHIVAGAAAGPTPSPGPGGTDPRIVAVLDDLHDSGRAALADLRRLVAVLRAPGAAPHHDASPVARGSLPVALDAVVERAGGTGLVVASAVDPAVAELDAVRALAVLRLAQEGLANAAAHAGPGARAELTVRMADDVVRLTIHDDGGDGGGEGDEGGGRAGPPAPGPGGHGLVGMRERVGLLGGRLTAGPSGRGWRLTAELPAVRTVTGVRG